MTKMDHLRNRRFKHPLEDNGNIVNNSCSSRTEYHRRLDHKRTNNNRICNISKLLTLIYYFLMILFPITIQASPSPVSPISYAKAYENIYNSTTKSNANNTISISSKNYSPSQVTSISRPFYAKITSDDAVAKPSNYYVSSFSRATTTRKPRNNNKAHKKPSKLFSTAPLMESTTEKSVISSTTTTIAPNHSPISSSFLMTNTDSGPKIRLEPFFNLLTNFQSLALGTSNEQKFSPSYQTITQSIDENTKKSQANKSTKGMRDKKKRNNNKKRNKVQGPIPIPIPKPLINPEESSGIIDSGKLTLHPLDVLNIPIITAPKPTEVSDSELFTSLESITTPSHGPYEGTKVTTKKVANRSSDSNSKNNNNKTAFNSTSAALLGPEGPESRERRLRSDFFENFHDKDVDLLADESGMQPEVVDNDKGTRVKPNAGRNVNIPQGYTDDTATSTHQQQYHHQIQNDNPNLNPGGAPFYSTIYHNNNAKKEDINMISKYPVSFAYDSKTNQPPTALGIPPLRYPIPIPYPKSKLRPNLHSYYDPHYHSYVAHGESHNNEFSNNNYPSGYGNHPPSFNNFNNLNKFGSHYVGHHLLPSSVVGLPHYPQQQQQQSQNLHQDNNNQKNPTVNNIKPVEATSELVEQGSSSDNTFDVDKTSSTTNSNQKIGIMDSFELFYKQYKLLAWASFLVVTSLALLSILVYLYVNSPPTEVVTARNLWNVDNLLDKPQIIKFLSSLVEINNTGSGGDGRLQNRRRLKTLSTSNSKGGQHLTAIKKDL